MLTRIRQTKEREVKTMPMYQPTPSTHPSLRSQLLQSNQVEVIAEIKRASPSRGVIREEVDIESLAKTYERSGACAISVLTDDTYFHGNVNDLRRVARVTTIPLLAKDFIFSPKQVDRARYFGAHIVLVIARFVTIEEAKAVIQRAKELHMDIFIEVHTKKEIEKMHIFASDAIFGVNNRDLSDFTVSFEPTNRLHDILPRPYISESGFFTETDVRQLYKMPDALLIGTALMLHEDPEQLLQTFQLPKEVH